MCVVIGDASNMQDKSNVTIILVVGDPLGLAIEYFYAVGNISSCIGQHNQRP
jgi:hypothetical protein